MVRIWKAGELVQKWRVLYAASVNIKWSRHSLQNSCSEMKQRVLLLPQPARHLREVRMCPPRSALHAVAVLFMKGKGKEQPGCRPSSETEGTKTWHIHTVEYSLTTKKERSPDNKSNNLNELWTQYRKDTKHTIPHIHDASSVRSPEKERRFGG